MSIAVGAACPLLFLLAAIGLPALIALDNRRNTTVASTPCPSCRHPKGQGKYLCLGCWSTLPMAQRRLLNRRDSHAMTRLQELYTQVAQGVPLGEVQVSP